MAEVLGTFLIFIGCYGETMRIRVLDLKENWRTAAVPTIVLIPMFEANNNDWAYRTFEHRYFHENRDSLVLPRRQRWFFHDFLLMYKSRSWLERDESPHDEWAVNFLGYAGETFDGALDTLNGVMTHHKSALRQRACHALGGARERGLPYLPSLIKAIDDSDDDVGRAAIYAIGSLGRIQFNGMADQQMMDVFDRITSHKFWHDGTTRDLYLNEMIRRGGSAWEQYLIIRSKSPPGDPTFPTANSNLEIITALRRIQGRHDPMRIVVKTELQQSYPPKQLPKVKVRIENVDEPGASVGFTQGGDYRSGRQDRWRIDVRDKAGKAMPLKQGRNMGGIHSRGNIKKGDGWETTLDMNKFVAPLPPGDYTVVILYHDMQGISNERDLSDLILSRSESFTLRVRK